jgi:hypothetical protein
MWWIKLFDDDQMRLCFCLQALSISEKLWQYCKLSLLDRQLLKPFISFWHGLYCCCWYCCGGACCCYCCCWAWPCPLDPPIKLRTAWCATSEPAPKAMPLTIVLPIPENIPPLLWACG